MNHEQRKKFWAAVSDVSRQVPLHIEGVGKVMADKESWRLVFCAGLMGEQRIARGINGEQVVLGLRLRDIFAGLPDDEARALASSLIELVIHFGDSHQVVWSDPKILSLEAA